MIQDFHSESCEITGYTQPSLVEIRNAKHMNTIRA